MPVKVVDASAIAAILFNEPDAEKIVKAIALDTLITPSLISFELASACLKKIRAHPRQRDHLVAAFQLLPRLAIEAYPVDLDAAISMADDTGLTLYDACYLWLAREHRCELVTLDRKLAKARRK